MNMQDFLMYRI